MNFYARGYRVDMKTSKEAFVRSWEASNCAEYDHGFGSWLLYTLNEKANFQGNAISIHLSVIAERQFEQLFSVKKHTHVHMYTLVSIITIIVIPALPDQ